MRAADKKRFPFGTGEAFFLFFALINAGEMLNPECIRDSMTN